MSIFKSIMDGVLRGSSSRRNSATNNNNNDASRRNSLIPNASSSTTEEIMGNYAFKTLVFKELTCDSDNLNAPKARSGHRIVVHQDNFYSFGGYVEIKSLNPPFDILVPDTQHLFKELWKYNLSTETWELLPIEGEIPEELASHSALMHGDYLVTYGGTSIPFGSSSSNKFSVCDLRTLKFRLIKTNGEPPFPQYGQAIAMDNKSLFVVGGTSGTEYSIDVHRLDLSTFTWEQLYKLSNSSENDVVPKERYRHEIVIHNDKIFIFGGGTAHQAYSLKEIPVFDVNTRQWSYISTIGDPHSTPHYPGHRKCHVSVRKGDDVYICGGYTGRSLYDDVWKFNLRNCQWTKFQVKMPIKLYFHSASITDSGCLFLFGGVTNDKLNKRTNRAFKVWLNVPSLKEMAFEAVTHYQPNLKNQSVQTLLSTGIPSEYVDRLHPTHTNTANSIPAPAS